jgi:hypothetical protein
LSPNIKLDVPTPAGYQTVTTSIDFAAFNDLVDGSNGVGTISPPPTVHHRVYVEVHNRGRVDATNVRVMAAITNAGTGLSLPAGYTANVIAGTPLPGPKWTTLQVAVIPEVRAGYPGVAFFDLPSTVLPLPASLPGNSHYCMVVFLHSAEDPFTSTERNVDLLALADRKVGQKNLHIVEFVGTPPPPGTGLGVWAMLLVQGGNLSARRLIDLVVDARQFPGTLGLVLPPPLFPKDPVAQATEFSLGSSNSVNRWVENHTSTAERLFHEAKYPKEQFALLLDGMKAVVGQRPLALPGGQVASIRDLPLTPSKEHAVFIRVDLPTGTKIGSSFSFDITARDSETAELLGGSRYLAVVNLPAGDD